MRLRFNLAYLPRPDQLPTLVEEQGTFAVCYMSGTALVDIPAASEAQARIYQIALVRRYFPDQESVSDALCHRNVLDLLQDPLP
jgi:hypothetical protein